MSSSMRNSILDSVAEDLFSLPPLVDRSIRRRLLKTALAGMREEISPHHIEIMKTLAQAGPLHISEVGRRLHIARPQMTYLIDKLVSQGMVERRAGTADRRTITIALTSKGRMTIQEHDRLIKDAIKATLSRLTNEELEELSISLRKQRDIFSRLQ